MNETEKGEVGIAGVYGKIELLISSIYQSIQNGPYDPGDLTTCSGDCKLALFKYHLESRNLIVPRGVIHKR